MLQKKNNWYSNRAKKNALWSKIKALGAIYGEDDAFMREYGLDVYNAFSERLDEAIKCFDDLLEQAKWIRTESKVKK